MRKKFGVFVALCLVAVNVFASAEAENYTFRYGFDNDSLTIESAISKKFLTVMVSPYGKEYSYAEDVENSGNVLFKVIDESEEYPFEILLSESLQCGKYTVKITDGKTAAGYVFIRPSAEFDFSLLVSKLNGADKSAFSKILSESVTDAFGIKSEDFQKLMPKIAECLYNFKPSGGYSAQSLTENFTVYEGMVLFSKGEITFEKLVSEYGIYFDGDISEKCSAFTDDEKRYADESRKYSDFSALGAQKGVENIMFLAQYKGAASEENLKNLCIERFYAQKVDMTSYNSIGNDYYKSLVWKDMFEKRTSATDVKSVLEYFADRCSAQALAAADKNNSDQSPSSLGGRGGSSVGFGSYGANTENIPSDEGAVFSDILNHWAKSDIEKMCGLKIINGFEDGTFRPDNYVSRAEFVKMLTAILDIKPESGDIFDDVKSSDWYAPYIAAAYNNNIIKGLTKTSFAPNEKISRQDAVTVVYRAVSEILKDDASSVNFGDENDTADYANEAVKALSANGLISGSDGKFYPLNNMTRAEAASFLLRVYNLRMGV